MITAAEAKTANLTVGQAAAVDLLREAGDDFHLIIARKNGEIKTIGHSDGTSQGWMLAEMLAFTRNNCISGKEAACGEAIISLVRQFFFEEAA